MDPDGCSKFWFPLQRDLIVAKPKSPILTVKSSWRKMSIQSQGFRRVTATNRSRILLLLYLTIPPFTYSSVYFIASLKIKRTLKFNSQLHNCVFCCQSWLLHKQRTLKHRNSQHGSKSNYHKSQIMNFSACEYRAGRDGCTRRLTNFSTR